MRILMVNPYAIPPSQPGGTRHFSLARALQAMGHPTTLVASGFDHTTRTQRLGPGEAMARTVHEGVPFLWLRTPGYRGSGGAARLWNMLVFARTVERRLPGYLDVRPDLVVGSSPHLFGAQAALRLARRLGVPFVLEIRDVWPQSLVEVMGVSRHHPLVWLMERAERQLYRGADHIVTLLAGLGPRVAERGGDPRGLTWVPNGIDLGLVPPLPEPAGRPPFTFMYAGSHGITNALDVLLDAVLRLRGRGLWPPGRARLVLLGTGPEKPRLEARVRAEGIPGVEFRAPVPKREVFGALAEADAFLVSARPSPLWRHGISFNKLFDFMAVGRPIVFGMDCPGNPIEEAGCGFIVRPGDPEAMAEAMARLLALSPEHRRDLGRRGRASVEARFDMRILAARFAGALDAARAVREGRDHAC
jgi:glycosyltransferase involved in cell wall biosynthesis